MRIVHSPMAKSIKEHSGGKSVFSSAHFYCINEGYTAAISCATAFLCHSFSVELLVSWQLSSGILFSKLLGQSWNMCFTSLSYTGEHGQNSLPHWPQQPTTLTKEMQRHLPALWGESSGQELCCASGRGRECRWLQMMILKCLKWFVEMEAALSCLQCKEQCLRFPGSGPWIWTQSCSGANLMLVSFHQLGFI